MSTGTFHDTVDGGNTANQLRLVVYPIYRVSAPSQVVQDFFYQQYGCHLFYQNRSFFQNILRRPKVKPTLALNHKAVVYNGTRFGTVGGNFPRFTEAFFRLFRISFEPENDENQGDSRRISRNVNFH